MRLLYPSHPLKTAQPDEQFAEEVMAVRAAGFEVSFFSLEKFQTEEFRVIPPLLSNETVLYRGWMLSASEYEALEQKLNRVGASPLVSTDAYLATHYLPNWYPHIKDLTPETRIYPPDCDIEAELRALNWSAFFIKDYVKSLKTSVGSRISKPEEVSAVVSEMVRFRGTIEGGFCVRRIEDFLPGTDSIPWMSHNVRTARGESWRQATARFPISSDGRRLTLPQCWPSGSANCLDSREGMADSIVNESGIYSERHPGPAAVAAVAQAGQLCHFTAR